jgi:hypothetical protein
MKTFIEIIKFAIKRKKFILIPLIIALSLFGLLFVATQGSALAPFIYTIF